MLTRDVRATCPTCGTVDVRAGHVTILPCIEVLENVYRFCCPKCTSWIVRSANPSTVMLLLRAGAYPAQRGESLVDDRVSLASIADNELRNFPSR